MLQIDVHSTVLTATILIGVAAVLTLIFGIRNIAKSRNIPFYKKRHDRVVRGWRLILLAVILVPVAWLLLTRSEPVIYQFISPSPTPSQTATITLTPTITLSPTISLTPTITDTPSITSTPGMPEEVQNEFEGEVTPNPDALFSPLQFARQIDDGLQPVDPATEFDNPVGHLYGTFSYNNMTDGVQWSALWYWEGELVYYESSPWLGGSGGYGYTDWDPDSDQWLPGNYEVQIFVGTEWKVSGYFIVTGDPATPTITPTSTQTATATDTPTATRTPQPTDTRQPTTSP
ncbi:hypothetical protein KQH50_02220 [bacterium]|nr:hypothetical protein [bacterium]